MDDLIRHPLAHARIAQGWSQEDLARKVRQSARRRGLRSGVNNKRISPWETNYAAPNEKAQLLTDFFGVDGRFALALGWLYWLPGSDSPIPLGSDSSVHALREAPSTAMDRRAFLTHSAAALAT
ncbi:hypothetical protein GCM10010211_71010 [Streptomyces albospinus]|uniref:HTH cro/C1-type domain-containing protein n=1 Tax=Streptomyces albospinus TaxID=285515 RepID=A0ABQ2VP24_9ACTN|nr:helix-turn-helix transcriptional regulator [Streptomyces albospinus]GGU93893.1 hypothetical protein GCM10010211_71010 [Streptomyces albospinus]